MPTPVIIGSKARRTSAVPGQATRASALMTLPLGDPRWSDFVAHRPEATALHLPAWGEFLADCYGFTSFALTLQQDGRIVAGLPVIQTRNALRKRRWVSLPFTDECQPLGESSALLAEEADAARRDAGVGSFEVRGTLAAGRLLPQGYSHRLALQGDLDALTRGYRSSVRQGIRVAAREGVTVRVADTAADLTHTFYPLHVATRRRLGVPVQRLRYFRLLWERLIDPGHGFVMIAERGTDPLAAAVFLHNERNVLYKYGASNAAHWKLRPNNALFQAAIAHSVELGLQTFDWGRTDFEDEGLRRFKAGWGSQETELTYSTLGEAREPAPTSASSQHRLARGLIRRSPSPVCRMTGALLYRYAA